jgi:uncharacterized protein
MTNDFKMDPRIVKFIEKHRILSMAVSDGTNPYCCTLFYAFDAERCNFYFMSSEESKHIVLAKANAAVAGTIVSAQVSIARLQGIQFTGRFFEPADDLFNEAKKIYLHKIPAAAFMSSSFWAIEVDFLKMTDNTLGFGKKLLWEREEIMSH